MAYGTPNYGLSEKFASWDDKRNVDYIRKAIEMGIIPPNDPRALEIINKYLGLEPSDPPQAKNDDAQKLKEELKKLL